MKCCSVLQYSTTNYVCLTDIITCAIPQSSNSIAQLITSVNIIDTELHLNAEMCTKDVLTLDVLTVSYRSSKLVLLVMSVNIIDTELHLNAEMCTKDVLTLDVLT